MTSHNESGTSSSDSLSGVTAHESAVELSYTPSEKEVKPVNLERDITLSHRDAQGGSPDDIAACGEEDIGAGLEFLVTKEEVRE